MALIEVTDPDDADSDMLTGALALGATTLSGDGADNFEVILDPLNGLWLALKAGASLDYESTGGSVVVTVTYTDSGDNAVSADATVTVTDANDAPVFAESEYAFDLNENADGSTTPVAVGMVSATDEDKGDTHTYSIKRQATKTACSRLTRQVVRSPTWARARTTVHWLRAPPIR